jgi:hypothetical protein
LWILFIYWIIMSILSAIVTENDSWQIFFPACIQNKYWTNE